jgi:hypothetical protein
VTLLGEYVHTKAEAQGINQATSNAAAAGAILFFSSRLPSTASGATAPAAAPTS